MISFFNPVGQICIPNALFDMNSEKQKAMGFRQTVEAFILKTLKREVFALGGLGGGGVGGQLWKCPERPRDLRCGSDLVCLSSPSVCPTKKYRRILRRNTMAKGLLASGPWKPSGPLDFLLRHSSRVTHVPIHLTSKSIRGGWASSAHTMHCNALQCIVMSSMNCDVSYNALECNVLSKCSALRCINAMQCSFNNNLT